MTANYFKNKILLIFYMNKFTMLRHVSNGGFVYDQDIVKL